MKTVIFFILLLAFINVQAKKKKQKHHHSVAKDKISTGFRVPIFAMRFPVFGGHAFDDDMKSSDLTFNDGNNSKVKLNTKTKTSNSTHGPFKTFTVTSVTTSGNKSNPRVFEKLIKSVTTMNKNETGKNITLPQIKETQFSIFRPFGFFGGFKGFADKPEPECSDKKPCAAEQFCDKYLEVCKKQADKGEACTQKDQCSKKSGNLQCTWGRCIVNSDVGGLGTFCDEHKDCSTGGAELGCFARFDISRGSKVCIAKLQEGQTCGRRPLFGMFDDENDEMDNERCQSSLVCRVAGFYGYKICQKAPVSDHPHKTLAKKSKHRHH